MGGWVEMNVNEKTSGLSRYSLLPLEAGASYHVLIFHEEFGKLYSFLLRTLSSSLNCYSQPWSLFFVFYLSCRLIFQEDMILIYSQDLWFNQEKKKKRSPWTSLACSCFPVALLAGLTSLAFNYSILSHGFISDTSGWKCDLLFRGFSKNHTSVSKLRAW